MKRLALTLAITMLALPAGAFGKGPSAASVEGPGTDGAVTFSGTEGSGRLGQLTEEAGFFPAAFGQEPSPMLAERPTGDLGPKYTITYTVPGPNNDTFTIVQDLYPYAESGAVTYTKPGQPIFDMTTRGGWYQGGSALKEAVVSAGLPEAPPASAPSSDGRSFPTVFAMVAALLVLLAVAFLLRRKLRPAARMAGSPG